MFEVITIFFSTYDEQNTDGAGQMCILQARSHARRNAYQGEALAPPGTTPGVRARAHIDT
eukprot:8754206-Karenia_brevis.AAC.1